MQDQIDMLLKENASLKAKILKLEQSTKLREKSSKRVKNMQRINAKKRVTTQKKILDLVNGLYAEEYRKDGAWNIYKISKDLRISWRTAKINVELLEKNSKINNTLFLF